VHAVATRRAARRIALLTDHEDPDRIAAAALLHDIGKLVLCSAMPSYGETIGTHSLFPGVAVREERRGFGLDHATAGATLLRRWGIHSGIVEAVGNHHNTTESHDGSLLCLADLIAHANSGGAVDPNVMIDLAHGLGVSPDDVRNVLFELQPAGSRRSERPDPCPLSAKELSLVRGLADGQRYKEIADTHGVAISTVRSHFSNIYAKLGVADRAQAVLMASTRGWL
jgi:putative nucleotidyltransferase with HDIG domain